VRDPDAWFESARKTILRGLPPGALTVARLLGLVSKNARGFPRVWAYVDSAIFGGVFEHRTQDREFVTALFSRWNQEVQRTVPKERLLVFQVSEGWEPLCSFRGVAVPNKPFPRSNDGASFEKRTGILGMAKVLK